MKLSNTNTVIYLIATVLLIACTSETSKKEAVIPAYVPDDLALFETIKAMDSLYFDAYNRCDLEKQAEIYADNIEFYHDQGGVMTVKQDIIDAIEKNICGKVTRELVKGSIEVYPIKDYGAIEIGFHKFYNNQEPDSISKPSKFITIWENAPDGWKMARVVSLH